MIELSIILPVSPERIYRAWLDGDQHAAFTGSGATAESVVGGEFTAWDGYISGSNLEFQPYSRIVQLWRTTDFPQESADSRLEILLEAVGKHTKLTLIQRWLARVLFYSHAGLFFWLIQKIVERSFDGSPT
jgi:uncharacterized protein YndB with AHSA1/START domain